MGPNKIFAGTKIVRCGSTLRSHETGGTGRIYERLSVQVWDLSFSGRKLAQCTSPFKIRPVPPSRVNAWWNRASFFPSKTLSGPM